MTRTTQEVVQQHRHTRGRKSSTFSEVAGETPMVISQEDADILGVYELLHVSTPFSDLPKELADRIVFVLNHEGALYLINTEGFNYCRYVAPCTIGPVSLRLVTVSVTVAVQEGTRPEKWIADAVQDNLETYAGEELVTITVVSDVPMLT